MKYLVRAWKVIASGKRGDGWPAVGSHGKDERPHTMESPTLIGQLPASVLSKKPRFHNRGVVTNTACQVVPGHDVLQILKNLRLAAEQRGPSGVRLAGNGIEMGADIARTSWVDIVSPDSAWLGRALEQHERFAACPLQLQSGDDPPKSSTDDADLVIDARGVRSFIHGRYPPSATLNA